MKLIAESGSTKTDWRCINENGEVLAYSTIGYNPYFMNAKEISEHISSNLKINYKAIADVYFYGAGCSDTAKQNIVKLGLSTVFEHATIYVESDLLGAARALCGREAGIAAILGTGSNACYYNGEQIQDTSTSLGFILGDEGGGTQIGKKLIQSFLYDQMPAELNEVFRLKYEIKREAVLDAVYHQSRPNAYLASFAKFAAEFQQHPFIEQLLESCFSEFFNNHISRYKSYTLNQIHFTGSIAVACSSILKKVAHKNGYEFVDILSSPVERLINYHRG